MPVRLSFPVGRLAARCSRGSNSGVESQPSKLLVAGSNPVSRSTPRKLRRAGAPGKGSEGMTADADNGTDSRGPRGRAFGGVIAHVAQLVEHVLGKDEVTSSILVVGSR